MGVRNDLIEKRPDVVERYTRAGVWLLRTDRDGTITVATDGERLFVDTFRGGLDPSR